MYKIKSTSKMAAIIAALLILISCNPLENESQSASLLTVVSIQGTDTEGNTVDFLQSDVVTLSGENNVATVFADLATAQLRVTTLDPAPIYSASQYNDVIVTRYVVSFSRTDGNNIPGVDVPYSFEGSLSQLIKAGSTESITFVIVREVAKMEPPLANLIYGTDVLEVIAQVDFYGHDLAERAVKATGYLTIFFANYADQ